MLRASGCAPGTGLGHDASGCSEDSGAPAGPVRQQVYPTGRHIADEHLRAAAPRAQPPRREWNGRGHESETSNVEEAWRTQLGAPKPFRPEGRYRLSMTPAPRKDGNELDPGRLHKPERVREASVIGVGQAGHRVRHLIRPILVMAGFDPMHRALGISLPTDARFRSARSSLRPWYPLRGVRGSSNTTAAENTGKYRFSRDVPNQGRQLQICGDNLRSSSCSV